MATVARIAAEMEENMEEIYMDECDYALRKRHGYWGWFYLNYLEKNNTAAWYTLLEREDCNEFMRTLNKQCTFRMALS